MNGQQLLRLFFIFNLRLQYPSKEYFKLSYIGKCYILFFSIMASAIPYLSNFDTLSFLRIYTAHLNLF